MYDIREISIYSLICWDLNCPNNPESQNFPKRCCNFSRSDSMLLPTWRLHVRAFQRWEVLLSSSSQVQIFTFPVSTLWILPAGYETLPWEDGTEEQCCAGVLNCIVVKCVRIANRNITGLPQEIIDSARICNPKIFSQLNFSWWNLIFFTNSFKNN